VHRADDQPGTIRKRLQVYREETAPLIRYFERSTATLLRVNGEGSPEDVQDEIRKGVCVEQGS
jgi:adenylate kinase